MNDEDTGGGGIEGGKIDVERRLISGAMKERSGSGPQREGALLRGGERCAEGDAGKSEEELGGIS